MKRLLARDDSVPVPWTKGLGKELLSAENPVARRFEAVGRAWKGGQRCGRKHGRSATRIGAKHEARSGVGEARVVCWPGMRTTFAVPDVAK